MIESACRVVSCAPNKVIYLFPGKEMKVGRQPDVCSVVLDSPEVPQMISRCHARLVDAEGLAVHATRALMFLRHLVK